MLAAPGLISLTKMPARLHEDHANAKMLADGLSRMSSYGVSVEGTVETNIVMFRSDGSVHQRHNTSTASSACRVFCPLSLRTSQMSAAKLCELLLSTSNGHEVTDGRVAQPIEYGKGPEVATNGMDNGTGVSVKVMPIHGDVIRAVTYYHISSEDIQLALGTQTLCREPRASLARSGSSCAPCVCVADKIEGVLKACVKTK